MWNSGKSIDTEKNESDLVTKTTKNGAFDRRVLLLAHLLSAAFVILLCVYGNTPSYERFGSQIIVIVILSFVSARFLYANTKKSQTFIVFYFRVTFLVIARLMIDEDDLVFGLLLLLPFVADCVICFGSRLGFGFSAAMTLFFAAFDLVAHGSDGFAVTLCRAFLEMSLAFVLVYYQRRLSEYSELLAKTINDRANLTEAIEKLTSANSGYQAFAEKATQRSAENERNRITREIHDVVGYALINVKMLMNVGKVYLAKGSGDIVSVFDSASAQVDSALQETRQILYAQRAVKPKEHGGLAPINALVKTFREIANIEVEINYGNLPASFDEGIDKVIYRMIQEGLVNAFKHGNADKVFISLWRTKTEIVVNVRDNGSGADKNEAGIGLAGMRERLAEFGGTLDAHKVADGYVLDARIPIPGQAAGETNGS